MKSILIASVLLSVPALSWAAAPSTIATTYLSNFAQQEQQLFTDLALNGGLSKAEWEQLKAKQWPVYLKQEAEEKAQFRSRYQQPASNDMQSCFNQALQLAGMSGVELINTSDSSDQIDMWALGSAICINETTVRAAYGNNNEIIAALLHELGHIRHKDDFHAHCLINLRSINHSLLRQWYHLREFRADVTALIAGYIDSRISFFEYRDFPANKSHPSAQDHTNYLKSLKNQS